jgi:superfamily II DNA or RNA helicase
MSQNTSLQNFLHHLQKKCLPGVWSKGAHTAKTEGFVQVDAKTDQQISLRVRSVGRPNAQEVELWPPDQDYSCDCSEKTDPCSHVAAAIIYLVHYQSAPKTHLENIETHKLTYHFLRTPEGLKLERKLNGENFNEPITQLEYTRLNLTQDDYALDRVIQAVGKQAPTRLQMRTIFKNLSGKRNVYLEQEPIHIRPDFQSEILHIRSENNGYRVKLSNSNFADEKFPNGVIRRGNELFCAEWFQFNETDERILKSTGKLYPPEKASDLIHRLIPQWRKMATVEILSDSLLHSNDKPSLILHRKGRDDGKLEVRLELSGTLDPAVIKRYENEVRQNFSLPLNQTFVLSGTDAFYFLNRSFPFPCIDQNLEPFQRLPPLEPHLKVESTSASWFFKTSDSVVDGKAVFSAYRNNESIVPIFSGQKQIGFSELPTEWLKKFAQKFENLENERSATLPMISVLKSLEAISPDEIEFHDETLKKLLFEPISEIQWKPPIELKAELRPYQVRGASWIHKMNSKGLGVFLADDMGLGKTVQAIAALKTPALIICPASLVFQWKTEIARFRPDWRLDEDITITTYGKARTQIETLKQKNYETLILDESHTIKNADSLTAQAIFQLKAPRRIALTGTPIENRLSDLQSQFRFLNPELANCSFSLSAYRPFILRRMKSEVAQELPPKTETVISIELSPEERKVYNSLYALTQKEVLGRLDQKQGVFQILEALLRLREAATDWGLLPGYENAPRSSKIEALLEHLKKAVENGHAILVFSQWTRLLDRVGHELRSSGLSYLRIDGSTHDRAQIVREFQKEDGPSILLLSLKSGGVGLNLTRADQVILLDPWWNPQVENQATDRAHRIGQKNPVNVYRFMASETIEERVFQLQNAKRDLSDSLLSGTDITDSISLNEIRLLFSN